MKKFILFLLTLVISIQGCMICLASNNPIIYADEVSLSVNEIQLLPVNIKNNSGIMGFKIIVEYPSEYINIKSITKGSVTSGGNFNHNLGLKENKVDIIWNSIEDVKKDGSLFVLGVELLKEITDDIIIKLSFSQEDTFNENWEDVVFDCKDIIISVYSVTQETTVSGTENSVKMPTQIDDSQVIDAVKITLEQNGYENLQDVDDTEKFIKDFNENLETITGSNEHNVADFDTIKSMYTSAYEGEFIIEITNNIDTDKIQFAVKETLDEFNVKSIDELDEKDKVEFVQKLEEKLKEQNPGTPNISEDLEADKALDIIEKLYELTDTKDNQQGNENNHSNQIIIVVVISVALAVLIAIVIIILKKKKSSNKDSQ